MERQTSEATRQCPICSDPDVETYNNTFNPDEYDKIYFFYECGEAGHTWTVAYKFDGVSDEEGD